MRGVFKAKTVSRGFARRSSSCFWCGGGESHGYAEGLQEEIVNEFMLTLDELNQPSARMFKHIPTTPQTRLMGLPYMPTHDPQNHPNVGI